MRDVVRTKLRCTGVEFLGDPDDPNTIRMYTYRAEWDPTLAAENVTFCKATPTGEAKLQITNPEAFPVVGKAYYVDFTPAE